MERIIHCWCYHRTPSSIVGLLPLFYEKAATPAMIKHGMDGQREAINYLDPDVASLGTADSFLKVSHLIRTRHTHQVTFLTLQKLQRKTLLQFETNLSEGAWRDDMVKGSRTFMFWDLIWRYETLILTFVLTERISLCMYRFWKN